MFVKRWLVRLSYVLILMANLSVAESRFDHSIWDQLLRSNVTVLGGGKATQVNYAAMSQQKDQLKQYLHLTAKVSQSDFDTWNKQEQLAFLINVYNARTVEFILTEYPNIDSIKDLGSFFSSPWKKEIVPLFDQILSLDDVEHGLIRGSGRYNDPRIHFAVNCASIGCPALRAEAYTGDKLNQQLEEQTMFFLSDETRNRLEGNRLKVSSIFKWYREDFEQGWRQTTSLASFLALYADSLSLNQTQKERLVSSKISISYLSYDWNLNSTP